MNPPKDVLEFAKQKSRFLDTLARHKQQQLSPFQHDELVVPSLLELCFSNDEHNIPLHAIWLLEKYLKAHPNNFDSVYPTVLERLNEIQIDGNQRIAGNILIQLLSPKINIQLTAEQEEELIELIFGWMIKPNKAVAVVANCFEILYLLSQRHDWVKDELWAQIDFFKKNGPPSIQARGKKILRLLKKNT